MPDLLFDKLNKLLHPSGKDIVVIISPGVGSNLAPQLYILRRLFWRARRVIGRSQNKDRLAFRQDFARVSPARPGTVPGEVIHRTVVSFGQPGLEGGVMIGRVRSRHAS